MIPRRPAALVPMDTHHLLRLANVEALIDRNMKSPMIDRHRDVHRNARGTALTIRTGLGSGAPVRLTSTIGDMIPGTPRKGEHPVMVIGRRIRTEERKGGAEQVSEGEGGNGRLRRKEVYWPLLWT